MKDYLNYHYYYYTLTILLTIILKKGSFGDFPGDPVSGNPPDNAGNRGSIPGPGRSHMPQNN